VPYILEQMALPADFSENTNAVYLGMYRSAWSDITSDDTVHLVTWSPKPRFINYDKHGDNDYNMQWMSMLDILLNANRCASKYAFVAEITDVGRLHMHGFIVVTDRIKYHKSFLPSLKRNGFVKVDKASSNKWKTFKYHVKEINITPQYITEYPVVINHINRNYVRKRLTLFKCLVAHNYEDNKIKKRNVMEMLKYEGDSDID